MTGRRTAMSDLDIVVLLHGDPAPYRASLRSDDWPVEMFVHTEATWYGYVEREVRKRRSPLLWMCADGELLFDTDGVGARIAAEARKLTAAGPPMVSADEIDDRRYAITDLLDDLKQAARLSAKAVGGAGLAPGRFMKFHLACSRPTTDHRPARSPRRQRLRGVLPAPPILPAGHGAGAS